jgi:PPOX class probable F420-dependent enzyme
MKRSWALKKTIGTTAPYNYHHAKGSFPIMAAVLSDQARAFLREHPFAVCSTINKDGSSQLTLVAYVLDDDETIVMNVERESQKAKNMRRDSRIALCVQDGNRYVSVYGTMKFLDDQQIIRRDLERLVGRFLAGDEETRQQYVAHLLAHPRVSLRFSCENVTEFLG